MPDPNDLSEAESHIREAKRWLQTQPSDPGTVAVAHVYATLAVAEATLAALTPETDPDAITAWDLLEAVREAAAAMCDGRHQYHDDHASVPLYEIDGLRAALAALDAHREAQK